MTVAEDGVNLLARCRKDSSAWKEAACGDGVGDEGRWTDPNATQHGGTLHQSAQTVA